MSDDVSPTQPDHILADKTDTTNDDFSSKSVCERLKILRANKAYVRSFPVVILWVIAGYMPAVFFTAWGAEFFAGCTVQTSADETGECEFDYNTYLKWGSLFSSLSGVVAFAFGGLVGRVSDAYGRIPIIYLNIILSTLIYAPLMFWPNVWISFALRIPAGINSSDNSFTPMMMAYMSDILPENQRTMAYSVAYSLCSIGLIIGVILAILLGKFFGDESNFIAITILDVLQIVYVFFFVEETLKPQHRKKFEFKNLNPLRPLYHCCCFHPIVLWVAMVQFFISLPETGILDMSLIYILDQLGIENETDANITNAIFILCCAFGLVLGPLIILPRLQSINFDNIQILCVGVSLFFIAFILLSLIAWIKSIVIVIISGVLMTSGFISFPAANGIVTKYLIKSEQGEGFGVIFAVRALTWIIAPYSFAYMYDTFKKANIPALALWMGAIMIIFAVFIILIPLKNVLNEADRLGKKYSFSGTDLKMMDNNINNRVVNNDGMIANNQTNIDKEMNTIDKFDTIDVKDIGIR